MTLTLNPVNGITITGMATAWPEELLGSAAYKSNSDVHEALLGDSWRDILSTKGWEPERAQHTFGIEGRSWTRGTEVGSLELGISAAEKALRVAGIEATDVDCIIAATSTPNHITSTMAARIANHLNTSSAAIDIRSGGAGGLDALATAATYHAAGCKASLVVAAEVPSKYLGRHDLSNAVLFGDGAVAIVLKSDHKAGQAGFAGAVIGNTTWDGTPFTVPGSLPPADNHHPEAYLFQRPDHIYLEQMAECWQETSIALRSAFPQECSNLGAVFPYSVTRDQVRQCAETFGLSGSSSLKLLAEHGCTGCASPLIAMALHWENRQASDASNINETVAAIAVAGGISWAGLLWRF